MAPGRKNTRRHHPPQDRPLPRVHAPGNSRAASFATGRRKPFQRATRQERPGAGGQEKRRPASLRTAFPYRSPARAGAPEPYFSMEATTPAPTVRPPSRMAKRRPWSMAIGAISSTSIATLSPGITISTPSGSFTTPVTSVVRK